MRTRGPADAPPLILLHGFLGAGADEWQRVVHGLQPFFRVMTLDLPGHGEHRLETGQYRDFDHVIDALAEAIERATRPPLRLLGYSLGGRIALRLALRHPHLVSRLILESASPGLRGEADRAQRRLADDALAQRLESMQNDPSAFKNWLGAWYAQPMFAGLAARPGRLEEIVALRARQSPAQLAAALRLLGTGQQPSLWESLPGLRMPALAIAGALDAKFVATAQEMAAVCPALRLEVVPECSHNVHAEAPDRYTALINAFLKEE